MQQNTNAQDALALVKTAKGEGVPAERAKTELLTKNSPLIKSIVKRYLGRGVEYDDLYQLGCLGFVKAINKYDATYGCKFTTYAVPLIAGEIKRFLRDDGAIKVSRSVKGLYVQIKRYLIECGANENPPTIDEMAEHFGLPREDIIYSMEASHLPVSLFEKTDGGEGPSLADRIVGTEDTGLIDKIMIKNMLDELSDRERKIMVLRYFRNVTQSEVARQLSISQVQVSRIEQKVLEKFREAFNREELA